LKTTRDGAKRCKTEEEVVELLDMLEGFVKPGLNKQEARLKKLAELSAKLTMDEPRSRAKELMSKQKEITTKFDLMDNDLFRLAEKLRERKQKGLPPKVQQLCVTVLTCMGKGKDLRTIGLYEPFLFKLLIIIESLVYVGFLA